MQFDREKTKRDKTKTANPGDDQQEAAQSSAAPCEWPLSRREFVVGAGVGAIGVAASSSWASPIRAPHATEPQEARAIPLALTINGHEKQLSVDPRTTLLDLLRENLKHTGTKKGCDHGQCGACTVLVEGRRVNSCLTLAATVDGEKVTTIEGLANGGEFHPVQAAFLDNDGFQCGYCTPGQIISAVALIAEAKRGVASAVTRDLRQAGAIELTDEEIRERMSGNICRCGAYPGIVAAVHQANGEPFSQGDVGTHEKEDPSAAF